jgi:Carbohydrate esterase, sialic acid-specific acetylesterase
LSIGAGMNNYRSLMRIVALLASGAALYLYGGYSASQDLWPWPWMRQLKAALFPYMFEPRYHPSALFTFDRLGRLTSKVPNQVVDCPSQDDRTAVFLIAGQSNAANYTGQRMTSAHGSSIVNFFDGRCYVAASPLLGSTGTAGEYWTETANLLVQSGHYQNIVLLPAAVGGTRIARWSARGDLNPMLRRAVESAAAAGLRVTHVLWHQGETDAAIGTGEEDYRSQFLSLVGTVRGAGVMAPIYVSVATKCLTLAPYVEDNPVARAQTALPRSAVGLHAGINSDQLLGPSDRYDDCHLSGSGTAKMAAAWASLLATTAKDGAPPVPEQRR